MKIISDKPDTRYYDVHREIARLKQKNAQRLMSTEEMSDEDKVVKPERFKFVYFGFKPPMPDLNSPESTKKTGSMVECRKKFKLHESRHNAEILKKQEREADAHEKHILDLRKRWIPKAKSRLKAYQQPKDIGGGFAKVISEGIMTAEPLST